MADEVITGWSYFGVRNPRHVAEDLDDMSRHHANAVLMTMSEEDVAFYRDTMRDLVSLAHDRGFTVYVNPWAWGGVFGGEAFSGFLPRNLDAFQIDSEGDPVPAACFNHPRFRDSVRRWIDAAAHSGADIAMWDEPHFFLYEWDPELADRKGRWTCRCAVCQEKFRELYGHAMPTERTPEVEEFRHRSIVSFLDDMTREARERGLKNSVCMLPPSFELDDGLLRPEDLFRLEAVDIVATDPYWGPEDDLAWVEEHYQRDGGWIVTQARRFGKQPEIWIKNFKIVRGQEPFVERATEISYKLGIRRILAWSYLGSAYMSSLRSDDPEAVYETQARAYAKCQEGGF